jgi:hypothetical protein
MTRSKAVFRHRTRIFFTLLDICRNIERMQVSPEARQACREVAGLIGATLAREMAARPASPRGGQSRPQAKPLHPPHAAVTH